MASSLRHPGAPRSIGMMLILLSLVLSGCDSSLEPSHSELELSRSHAVVDDGDTLVLEVYARARPGGKPVKLDPRTQLTWASSAPEVAEVEGGRVKARRPGEALITATSLGGASASAAVSVRAVPAGLAFRSDEPVEATVGASFPEPVEVTVRDRHGTPLPGVQVEFAAGEPDGNATPATGVSDSDGIARTVWRLGARAGEQWLEAAVEARGRTVADTMHGTARPGAPVDLVIEGLAETVQAGDTLVLRVEVLDSYGNQIPTAWAVRWSSGDPSVAAFVDGGRLAALRSGSTEVTATVEGTTNGGGTNPVSPDGMLDLTARATVAIRPGAAHSVTIHSGDSQSGTKGGPLAEPLVVLITDRLGNAVPGVAATWTTTGGGGSLEPLGGGRSDGEGLAHARWTLGGELGPQSATAWIANEATAAFMAVATGVSDIVVYPASVSVEAGAAVRLFVDVLDEAGESLPGQEVTWTSSDGGIAEVDPTGEVRGESPGAATITATSAGLSASATVHVEPGPGGDGESPSVGSVSLTPSELRLVPGETATVTASILDDDGEPLDGPSVTWSSTNAAVAAVDGTGHEAVVTALAEGSATVTSAAGGKEASVPVVVGSVPGGGDDSSGGDNSSGGDDSPGEDDSSGGSKDEGDDSSEDPSGGDDDPPPPPAVGQVAVSPSSVTLDAGSTATLSASVVDTEGNPMPDETVTWSSSNPFVAGTQGSGHQVVVTGVGSGSATITASAGGKSGSAAIQVAAGLVFFDDFETEGFGRWNNVETCCSHSATLVKDPVGSGTVLRTELRWEDPAVAGGPRAELTTIRNPAPNDFPNLFGGPGDEFWWGFRVFVPDEWVHEPADVVIHQIHGQPMLEEGERWRSPPFSINMQDGRWKVWSRWDNDPITQGSYPAGKQNVWDGGGVQKGTWTSWVIHARWAYDHGQGGFLRVWRDGQQVVDYAGPTYYNDKRQGYLKLGIYKWPWNQGPTQVDRLILYYDQLRVADRIGSYSLVAPR